MANCGVETKRGIPCQQSTEFFPCQYHNRVQFSRAIKAITSGQVVLCAPCPACEQYYPILLGAHTCAAAAGLGYQQAATALGRSRASRAS